MDVINKETIAKRNSSKPKTKTLKRCQSLYLAVASEVAALGYSDRSKLTQRVQEVLRDVEDTRVVSWLIDDMINHKPSDLDEMLEAREAKISKKYNFAKKVQDYNQPNPTPQKAKKKTNSHER